MDPEKKEPNKEFDNSLLKDIINMKLQLSTQIITFEYVRLFLVILIVMVIVFIAIYMTNCQTDKFKPYIPANITMRSDPIKVEFNEKNEIDSIITNEDFLFDARNPHDPESYLF